MKVIKAGNPQKGWAKKFSCSGNGNGGGGCCAVLLVEQGDVFLTHSSHYDGSHEVSRTETPLPDNFHRHGDTHHEDYVPGELVRSE